MSLLSQKPHMPDHPDSSELVKEEVYNLVKPTTTISFADTGLAN